MENAKSKRQTKKEAYAQNKGKMTKHRKQHNKVQNALSVIKAYTSVLKLFQREKFHVLQVTEFLKSFDDEVYICQTCNRSLSNKVIPCQAVAN